MPLIDHSDAVAQASNQFQIVLDQQLRAALRRDVLYQHSEALAFRLGESGRGLIQQQQARFGHNRTRDFDKVTLAERQ
jgi:hypothetical protein